MKRKNITVVYLLLIFTINYSFAQSTISKSLPVKTDFDVVILNGRVIDPETNLDAIRNVGVKDGSIGIITEKDIKGKKTIDATGKIVSPGFIDLHMHGLNISAYRMQAMQGVTTALELESGILPINDFYEGQATKNLPIHYGAAAAWTFGRIATFTEKEPEATADYFQNAQGVDNWKKELASPEQLEKILNEVEEGLKQGAIGIGVNAGYAPGNGHLEYYKVSKLAKKYNVGTFTHVRFMKGPERNNAFEAFQELIANAAATGVDMHICHINSSSQKDIENTLELFENAKANGISVTAGAYPWGAASTVIKAAMFTGPTWKEDMETDETAFQLGPNRLTKEQFDDLQANEPGTFIVWHFLDPAKPDELALMDASILHPDVLIESDAIPWYASVDGKIVPYEGDEWPLPNNLVNHPRSSATYTKILQDYVRDRELMSLSTAIKKMSLMPAQNMEDAVPQMKKKGRLQVGMDADVLVFDLNAIKVNANYIKPYLASEGMSTVLVMGTPVIENGELLLDAAPGQAIRNSSKD
ncbi:amidohydrolase family protein [Eudoraea chungangensis]|uniref:amidohydrolase family protein n=1 Tax=Eudoraea chungangensis TaxID=1481905 RepID=UPI0023EC8C73|nr:amidohydrolase family protein [Eudoraea chungangensis]